MMGWRGLYKCIVVNKVGAIRNRLPYVIQNLSISELNNFHNIILFSNLVTRNDREHVVLQLPDVTFKKFVFKT